MKRDPIEIVEVEDPKDAAELCYEVDGVFMTMAEHTKILQKRGKQIDRFEAAFVLAIGAAFTFFGLWLIKG